MESISPNFPVIVGIVGILLTLISTGIAIYQWAVIRESKSRRLEFQYVLAGVNAAALQKQQAWANQISTLTREEIEADIDKARIYVRARDDFADLAQMTVALEGTIDPNSSAISNLMDRSIEVVNKNNELQAAALKNPNMSQKKPEQTDVGNPS